MALAWFLDHPVSAYARGVRQAIIAGARAVVPALWHLEMANGLWMAERRGVLSAPEVEQSVNEIEAMIRELFDSEPEFVSLRQALGVARPFRLTAYDAVYLDAAQRHRLPLATLDLALRNAAAKAGVRLFAS